LLFSKFDFIGKIVVLMPEYDAKIRDFLSGVLIKMKGKCISRGILHCVSTTILSVFLANKIK